MSCLCGAQSHLVNVPTLRRVHTAQCMDIVTGSECVFQCS